MASPRSHREPHRARRSQHDVKPTPTGKIIRRFPQKAPARLRRYRAQHRGRARYRRRPCAGLRARPRWRSATSWARVSRSQQILRQTRRESQAANRRACACPGPWPGAAGAVGTTWAGLPGEAPRPSSPWTPSWDGSQEDVGHPRQGHTRVRLPSRPRRHRPGQGGTVVPRSVTLRHRIASLLA